MFFSRAPKGIIQCTLHLWNEGNVNCVAIFNTRHGVNLGVSRSLVCVPQSNLERRLLWIKFLLIYLLFTKFRSRKVYQPTLDQQHHFITSAFPFWSFFNERKFSCRTENISFTTLRENWQTCYVSCRYLHACGETCVTCDSVQWAYSFLCFVSFFVFIGRSNDLFW